MALRRFMTALRRTLLLFALLAFGKSFASEVPVVFALDTALSANQQVTAKAIISTLVRQLPDTSEVGLVVFDDVVQGVVPLERGAEGKAAVIDDALNRSTASYSSNLAAGFERTLAELDGRGAAHLLIFALATLASTDVDRERRNTRWVKEIMIPEAAAQGVAITFLSPATSADESLLEAIAGHPINRTLVLTSQPSLVDTLAARIAQAPSVPGTPRQAGMNDSPAAKADGSAVAVDNEFGTTENDPSDTVGERETSSEPAVAIAKLNPSDGEVISVPDIDSAGYDSRAILYAALIILATILIGLIVWFRRHRRQAVSPSIDYPESSAYLPLETTSRHRYRNTSAPEIVDDDKTRIKPLSDRAVNADNPAKPDDLPDPW